MHAYIHTYTRAGLGGAPRRNYSQNVLMHNTYTYTHIYTHITRTVRSSSKQ